MKKTKECCYLYRAGGWYVARIYDKKNERYTTENFLGYSKKEVISLLRNKYSCIVPGYAIIKKER